MKVVVTVKHTQTATLDIGDIPLPAFREILVKNEGTLDGNWSLADCANDNWVVDVVEVEPVPTKAR